jgi:hypothetical protein
LKIITRGEAFWIRTMCGRGVGFHWRYFIWAGGFVVFVCSVFLAVLLSMSSLVGHFSVVFIGASFFGKRFFSLGFLLGSGFVVFSFFDMSFWCFFWILLFHFSVCCLFCRVVLPTLTVLTLTLTLTVLTLTLTLTVLTLTLTL